MATFVNKSWRRRKITLPAGTVSQVSFFDTNPNSFYIQNNSSYTLYFGFHETPSASSYDIGVKSGRSKTHAEFTSPPMFMVYNPGQTAATIILISWESATFDPSMLVGDVDISGDVSGMATFDGVIDGFTAELPAGTQHIGTVGLDGEIPAGTKKIGSVDVANQNDYSTALASILAALGSLTVDVGDVTVNSTWTTTDVTNVISYLLAVQSSTFATTGKLTSITTGGDYTGKMVKLLTNDGDKDIKITFNGTNTFVLKPGESITDLVVTDSSSFAAGEFSIGPNVTGESITFRCLYL